MPTLGFLVATALFALPLVRTLGTWSWPTTIATTLAIAAGSHVVFKHWLGMPLYPWEYLVRKTPSYGSVHHLVLPIAFMTSVRPPLALPRCGERSLSFTRRGFVFFDGVRLLFIIASCPSRA